MEKRMFGSNLKKLREQSGLSQRGLAEKVGVDVSYLSKIENGVMPPPSQELILRLADALGADKDELLTLAGKVPADIAQILKNKEVLQSLREGDVVRKSSCVNENDSFGKGLRELREQAGLSQSQLADKVGISFTYLSKIENGVKPPPSEKVILKLAEALNCDKDDLMSSAGKLPSDIAQILKNREVRQSLRENEARRVNMTASGGKKGFGFWEKINRASGNRKESSMMKNLMNGRSPVRIALAFMLVFAVAASLWFASPQPARALEVSFPSLPGGNLGNTHTLSVTVDVANGELIPIQSINLEIFNSDNPGAFKATANNLPLASGTSKAYSNAETGGGGPMVVTASSPDNSWAFFTGTGYAYWQGLGYSFGPVSGYGYGYGYSIGVARMTYSIIWTSPPGWPSGNYLAKVSIVATSPSLDQTFIKSSSAFVLSRAGGNGHGFAGACAGQSPRCKLQPCVQKEHCGFQARQLARRGRIELPR